MDRDSLLRKYDRLLPRYTSYPTAPHFGPAIDDAVYGGWLADLGDAPLSLYLHVPFCDQLCRFCGCHTSVARNEAPLLAYAGLLQTEIERVASRLGRRRVVRHIHWGGGTPTALPARALLAVSDALHQRFDIAADAEIAVEIDPRTLEEDRLEALARMGITRVSLGVQDFEPIVQETVGRIQSYETTASCADRLRGIGVRSLNLDLIYGLPHQTEASVVATAERCLSLAPDRIAVFGYAHVPWMKRHQALLPEAALPDGPARFAQRAATDRVLCEAGFVPVGLDHYARPGDSLARAAADGTLRRNFQGYTTDEAEVLIGLGASAIGSLPQGYAQNAARVPEYGAALQAGRLPTVRGVALSPEDRLRRAVIEQVMCRLRVDPAAVARAHGADPAVFAAAEPALAELAADGLIARDGASLTVTERGRPFVRAVAAAFDAYLGAPGAAAATGESARRHSRVL
ncbi:MAG TPA: oxygen-independent coproporphyrinogen III oxidase [Acetobacteraceae bacterium]|nr:oxygen-independent coproporphyrinogen III oxidase [Acetobacteraceae bacterium]